jgi:hypothetical protein
MSAVIAETKSIAPSVESELSNLSRVSLADISSADTSAFYAAIDRVIPEPHIKPVPVAAFGSYI